MPSDPVSKYYRIYYPAIKQSLLDVTTLNLAREPLKDIGKIM